MLLTVMSLCVGGLLLLGFLCCLCLFFSGARGKPLPIPLAEAVLRNRFWRTSQLKSLLGEGPVGKHP